MIKIMVRIFSNLIVNETEIILLISDKIKNNINYKFQIFRHMFYTLSSGYSLIKIRFLLTFLMLIKLLMRLKLEEI